MIPYHTVPTNGHDMNFQLANTVSLAEEMVSYETLWALEKITLKKIADLFRAHPGLPSRVLHTLAASQLGVAELASEVRSFLSALRGFAVSVSGTYQYPKRLKDARHPIELFYYRGYIGLVETRCVSVVGARKASPEGTKRAAKLARELVEANITVMSGLAAGIDTAAMTAAIDAGGHTVGVIGTPINEHYPKENAELQECVARRHLLVSQVPFFRYAHQPFSTKRFYFPERNETMAALSDATVIVEASDTSGSLTQARAAIQQGRKLFILNSCFENRRITWPAKYEEKGAIRVRTTDDILSALGPVNECTDVEEG